MNYFLDTNFSESNPILNADESKHALRVLRIKTGEELLVGNGKGLRYRCSLARIENNLAHLKIDEVLSQDSPKNQLTIGIAPTKNPSRFEWFLEKSTEMGIWEVIPLISQNSERTKINEKRANKIVHAATKQSQRFYLPRLMPLTKLKDLNTEPYDHCFIAHCNPEYNRQELARVLANAEGKVLVLIGPEGDFDPGEIEQLQDKGLHGVSLGTNRLRTETAGIYTAAIFSIGTD